MGARKKNTAEKYKEQRKNISLAKLSGIRMSPRKVRLVADQIRGMEVNAALNILRFSPKHASIEMEKLLYSAISNWQNKNKDIDLEANPIYVKTIYVDAGKMLKRIQPAPHGRAHRIRKRSSHITIVVDTMPEEVKEVDTNTKNTEE